MKTHVFKRLSALMAGFAVALVGSLSALPQAHAATTYQLNQVGGSVKIDSVKYVSDSKPVPGAFSDGFAVSGEKRTPFAEYFVEATFSITKFSSLAAGDKVVIPMSASSSLIGAKLMKVTGSVGSASVGPAFTVTSNDSEIIFTATANVSSYSSLNGSINALVDPVETPNAGTQEQYKLNFGNDYYVIDHLLYTKTNTGWAPATVNHSYVADSFNAKPVPNLDFRLAGLANAAIDGTVAKKFPEAVDGDIWQYAVITPLTRPIIPTLYENATNSQQLASDGTHFSQYDGGSLGRNIAFTKKSVKAVDLAKPADVVKVLKAGEYALFDNGDGTWTYAVNWGKWQGNARTAIPNPIPTNITDTALKAKLDEYRGQGHGVQGVRSRVKLEFQGVTNNSPQSYQVDLVNGIGTKAMATYSRTKTNVAGVVSGDGSIKDATVFYAANGATSGSAPANLTTSVGSKVTIASKGSLARTGHTFTGWNTKADGTGTKYTENQQVTLGKNGLRLYAQWAANTYTVTFNGNGATGGKTAAVSGKYDTKGTMTANGFTRTGYEFTGWNTKADGTGAAYADKAAFTFKGNVTVYAQWKALADTVPVTPGYEDKPGSDPNKPAGYVTVTFAKGAHGTLSGTSAFHVNPAKAVTLKAPSVKASTGWKFSKWDKKFAGVKFTKDTTITAQYVSVKPSPTATPSPTSSPTKPAPTSSPSGKPTSPVSGVGDKVKDEDGNPVKPSDESGKDVSKVPVDPDTKVSVDDKVKCKSVTDTGCVAVDSKGNAVVRKDKDGNAPAGVTVKTQDTNGDGVVDKVTVTGVKYPSSTCAAADPSKQEKVYRLYNPGNSEHLFTTDAVEYEVLADKHGWKQEGVAWVGPNAKGSSVGVYRLYNAGLGDHHYTKDQAEAKKLVAEFGWVYDNNGEPLFYSEDNDKCARIDVYRQYNGGLKTGQHHYTADKTEWDTLAAKHGWQKEGIGWYALSWPNPKG